MYTSSYFTLRHKRSTKMLSNARPRPSQLIRISAALSRLVNSWLVNCTPWSVLKISGRARLMARSSPSKQNLVSIVTEMRPRQHVPTVPINDRHQIDEPPLEADVRDT